MSFKNFIYPLLIFVIVFIISCKQDKNDTGQTDSACIGTAKIDSLISSIVLIGDMYSSIPSEKKHYQFLVSEVLKPKLSYYSGYLGTLYTVNRNVALENDVSTLYIDSAKFYDDSNSVDVVTRYYIMSKLAATTTWLTLKFDTSNCYWIVTKQSTALH